jgi:toxin FitB
VIVVDTNVVSELIRDEPARDVVRWVAARPLVTVYCTAVTQAEIMYGLHLLPKGRRRARLETAVARIFDEDLGGRVLPFDHAAALGYATIRAARRQAGRPISNFDAQIAAICRVHGAALATRDLADFVDCGIRVFSPWAES